MNDQIEKILEELCAIDPSFKQHEKKLVLIIQKLIESKPQVKIDQSFIEQLRAQLLNEAQELSQSETPITNNFNLMKKFGYLLGGAVITGLLIIPALYLSNNFGKQTLNLTSGVNLSPQINLLADGAFGPLTGQPEQLGVAAGRGTSERLAAAAPQAEVFALDQAAGLGGGGTATKISAGTSMPAIYPYYVYKYVYQGEPLILDETKMEVFKKDKTRFVSVGLNQLIKNLDLGLIDLNTFNNTKIQSLNFVEDKNNGLMGWINFEEGTISINPAGEMIVNPQPEVPLKESQVPPNQELITAANAFIKKHGISLAGYGQPIVRDEWRLFYETSQDRTSYYIPDVSTVVYPLEINGVSVYDQNGYNDGLMVSVSNHNKQVLGAWNIGINQYQASLYDVETDIEKIIKQVNSHNGSASWIEDANVTELEVKLGPPKLGLVKTWHWNGQRSEELLVPAYIFPVTQKPQGQDYFQQSLVVPIATDLLNEMYGGYGGGGIIMPLKGQVPTVEATPPTQVDTGR